MKVVLRVFALSIAALLLVVLPVMAVATMPDGETRRATYITTTTARLNAYITSNGSDNVDVQFQYYTGTENWTAFQTGWVAGWEKGESPYVDITGLTTNTTYNYRVQIRNSFGTFNGSAVGFTAYAAPTMPNNWLGTPDVSRFRNAFFYGMYNYIADRMKTPRDTFYMGMTIFWCMVLAIATLIIGKRLMPAVIMLTGAMAISSLVGLLPMFFMGFTLIAVWGFIKMGHPREE